MKMFIGNMLIVLLLFNTSKLSGSGNRNVVNLNGQWEIAKTSGLIPLRYTSTALVPGLVDMAVPAIDTAGSLFKNGWYWYKRNFELKSNAFDIVKLKIFKAKYHTKVFVNNKFVGENLYCFTPSYFDIKSYLNPAGQPNEVVIGVGNYYDLPDTIPNGRDNEKLRYIPGIYDNVELSLSDKPYISNVQTVPDIINDRLRVVAEIRTDNYKDFDLRYLIKESKTGKIFTEGIARPKKSDKNDLSVLDFEISMKESSHWTPESPFMYNLILLTSGDKKEIQFGMRTFRFDNTRKIALLNEQPYYMRGTNVCIFRFFEDKERAGLPWNNKWVIDLHKKFKNMNWNGIRYCIGYPPERWYEIADSLGFLIQDEYPLWHCSDKIKARHFAGEFTRRMSESWNHPCIVIWDAQNETRNIEIGKAIQLCRPLDLSNRPWENGFSKPQVPTDPMESHPYLFMKYVFRAPDASDKEYLKIFFGISRKPNNDANDYTDSTKFDNPYIINEYGWLWLNRDGSTTTLTDSVYTLWGRNLSTTQRRTIYARHLAILTEYWRAHRKSAAIFHFCGLGYSRPTTPRGQTSDNWVDIKNLEFEPMFYKYVRPAFSPVGLMIDTWNSSYKPGSNLSFPVYIINDLARNYKGTLKVKLQKENKTFIALQKEIYIEQFASEQIYFSITFPELEGDYEMNADITLNGESVMSYRDIKLLK